MSDFYERTRLLIGDSALSRIKGARVFVAGLGGVGGYVVEALSRAGVGSLGLCDFDRVDVTNINRQIYALNDTVGLLKADVARERVKKINAGADVVIYPFRIDESTISSVPFEKYDYVVDAIDDVRAKVLLIRRSKESGTPVISCMGTGNKLDPSKLRIADVEKTDTCPLAKVVRKELKQLGIKDVPVLFSTEPAAKPQAAQSRPAIASISYMPAVAGLMIAGRVLKDLGHLST